MVIIYAIRTSLNDDEVIDSDSDSPSGGHSLPFNPDEIKAQVELKLMWYINEMLSYDIDLEMIGYLIDLVSKMYGLTNRKRMKLRKLLWSKSMIEQDRLFE
jgi:hypothetical protein